MDVQLVFARLKRMDFQLQYGGTFQGLIQADTTVKRKASTWSKGSKDGNKIKLE